MSRLQGYGPAGGAAMYRLILVVCPALLAAGLTLCLLWAAMAGVVLALWSFEGSPFDEPRPALVVITEFACWTILGVSAVAGVACGVCCWKATLPRQARSRTGREQRYDDGMYDPITQSRLFRALSAQHPSVQVWEDDDGKADGWSYCWIVSRTDEETRMLARVRHRPSSIQRRGYDQEGEEVWTDAE